jgi:hypothetical protein
LIDANVVRSPGWFFKRLMSRLSDQQRKRDLQLLDDYLHGNAPLPQGAENARSSYEAFMKMARGNFAELITNAVGNRMLPVGFSSVREDDATGDAEIGSLWHRAMLPVTARDTQRKMLALRESYVVVGEVDDETDAAIVTCEDPRWMVGIPDPVRPHRLKAALKLMYDEEDEVDRAFVYLDGVVTGGMAQVWVATRKSYGKLGGFYGFNHREWTWDPAQSGELIHPRIPVVRFNNLDDLGEYEPHLDLLDRINHQVLQRMTIAVMQAFRQRWVKGLPTHYPDDFEVAELRGKEIDYSKTFVSDPAAFWQLPPDADIGESAPVDLTPLVNAIKSDVQHLAFVTSTPLHMMDAGGDNQSAEGANLAREGLLFKAKDRIERVKPRWSQVVGLMLLQAGETDLTLIRSLQTKFAPPELLSLAERADAASKAVNDVPRRSRLLDIWGFEPEVVDRMMTEWAEEQLLAQQVAALTAAATSGLALPSRQQPGQQQLPAGQQGSGAAGQGQPVPAQGGQQRQPVGAAA